MSALRLFGVTLLAGALFLPTVLAPSDLAAQGAGTVTGLVADATTNRPLAAAQVYIPDLDIGVLTQQNGRYILLNVPAGTHTLTVERIGYRTGTQTITVASGQTVPADFAIAEEALSLDEVIVTGTPGGTRRRALGNSVARLDISEVTQNVPIASVQDLLSGRTPGVQFTRLSGNVGTGSPIKIRGVGSFSQARSQPIIFIDGIRVNDDVNAGPNIGSGTQVSVLDDINFEDVESIEVIKGPAAASLYGAEASAGVIQIITKRGREGAPQFSVSIRQGANFLMDPAGKIGTSWFCPTDPSPGPADCSQESEAQSYSMYDEANRYIREGYFSWPTDDVFRNGHVQSYNADIRGGTAAVRYFVSANYDNEQGIVWYNYDKTARIRGNLGLFLTESLSFDLTTSYSDGTTRFMSPAQGQGGVFNDLAWSNGYWLDRVNPFDTPQGNARLGGFQEHLPTDVADVEATRDYSRFIGSASLNFSLDGIGLGPLGTATLTQRGIIGLDRGVDINRVLYPLHDGSVPAHLQQYINTWDGVYPESSTGALSYERPIVTTWSVDYSLAADLAIGAAWGLQTAVGFQYVQTQEDTFGAEGSGFASPFSTTINQLAPSTVLTNYSFIENKSLGLYVQQMVGWNDRLFVTGAMRFDRNSTFGADAPAQRFPKVSAAWVVSEEGFWSFEAINLLRLRGAWGQSGRQPDATSNQNIYVAVPGPGGTSAIKPSSPGNPGIEPEVSTELEVGFDFALLEDRLSGEFTHYWRKDESALLGIAVPTSWGFPGAVDQNVGRIDNWGWEASVFARLYEGQAFTVDLDMSASFTDNEVKDLGGFPGSEAVRIGLPYPYVLTDNWVVSAQFEPGGYFSNAFGQTLNAMCDEGRSLAPDPGAPGAASRYGRLPGGAIRPCQEIVDIGLFAGRAFHTHTYTVGPRVTALGGDLVVFALAEGQYGRTGLDNLHMSAARFNNTKPARLENDPAWVADDRLNNGVTDWGFYKGLYDADFWKLREIGLTYSLPESLLRGVQSASVGVSARNLWTIWQAQEDILGVQVADPEYASPSVSGLGNYYNVPPLSSLTATLRVTF